MDKIAANNHFVGLRKEVKKAKAMVSGNLIRKIGKLKLEKEKLDDEAKIKKVDDKIAAIYEEVRLLKTLDPYTVSKNATLRPDPKLWTKIISDSKATIEERLTARVIIKNNIQKTVLKFRTDYKDCDEWINEYIEYREKKREIEDSFKSKSKSKKSKNPSKVWSSEQNLEIPKEIITNNRPKFSKKMKRSDPDQEDSQNTENLEKSDALHPSWEIKRKEKEILKAALSGELSKPKRITFDE